MDDADVADKKRPASGMRGRATRRGGAGAAAASSAQPPDDNGADNDPQDDGEPAGWKVELESIMSGTHPSLIEALEPHDAKMKGIVAQADKVKQLQMVNINALFDCEKKQADDESKVRARRDPCGRGAQRLHPHAQAHRSAASRVAPRGAVRRATPCFPLQRPPSKFSAGCLFFVPCAFFGG